MSKRSSLRKCKSKRRTPSPMTVTPVSSRGCSRSFIVCFLARVLEHCRSLEGPPVFPFSHAVVSRWLELARLDCVANSIMIEFGGVPFYDHEPSSYWTSPDQYFTWWKNNVERRKKFQILKEDAFYEGADIVHHQRAKFCANVVVLAVNIRNHFEKSRVQDHGRSVPGAQYKVPFLVDVTSIAAGSPISNAPLSNSPDPAQFAFTEFAEDHDEDSSGGGGGQRGVEVNNQGTRVMCFHHISEEDMNGVEDMMQTDVDELPMQEAGGEARPAGIDRELGIGSPHKLEWEVDDNRCFKDEFSDTFGDADILGEGSLGADEDDDDFLDELTCVKCLRVETPRMHCSSTTSLTSCSSASDCDDRSFTSSVGPSPLPSPYVLDRATIPELGTEVCFDDYFNSGINYGAPSSYARKETAWAPISSLSSPRAEGMSRVFFLSDDITIPSVCNESKSISVSVDPPSPFKMDKPAPFILTAKAHTQATNKSARVRKLPHNLDVYEI